MPCPSSGSKTAASSSGRVKTRLGRRASVSSSAASLPDSSTGVRPAADHPTPGDVEPAPAQRDHRRGVGVPAQQGPQPGQQLVDLERFDQVVLGAGVQPLDPIGERAAGGQDQDRRADPPRPQPADQVDAVDRRQPPVDHHQLVAAGEGQVQPRLPVAARGRPRGSRRAPRRSSGPSTRSSSTSSSRGSGRLLVERLRGRLPPRWLGPVVSVTSDRGTADSEIPLRRSATIGGAGSSRGRTEVDEPWR